MQVINQSQVSGQVCLYRHFFVLREEVINIVSNFDFKKVKEKCKTFPIQLHYKYIARKPLNPNFFQTLDKDVKK